MSSLLDELNQQILDLKARIDADAGSVIAELQVGNISDEYFSLFANLRGYYTTHDSEMFDLSVLGNQECEDLLIAGVKGLLHIYDQFQIIRKCGLSVTELCEVLTDLFNNCVLHADHSYVHNFSSKPFDTVPCATFANAYAQLIYDVISKLLYGETLRDEIKFNTGLGDDLVNCIANLIENNFETLKLNYLIISLRGLDD